MVKAKLRKKYSGPTHLWQMDRIKEESQLKKDYGYKNKKELWKVASILRNFRAQARRLIPLTDKQSQVERKNLIDRLISLGIVKEGAELDDVLGLDIKDLMERRLQTLVLRKRFANTIKQARQFITHRHIDVNGKKITSPSTLIRVLDEPHITFTGNSSLVNEMHPERVAGKEKREKKNKAEAAKELEKEVKAKAAEAKAAKAAEEAPEGVSKEEIKEIEKVKE